MYEFVTCVTSGPVLDPTHGRALPSDLAKDRRDPQHLPDPRPPMMPYSGMSQRDMEAQDLSRRGEPMDKGPHG